LLATLDPATGTFTAAKDGYYHVDCQVLFNGSNSGCVVLDIIVDDNDSNGQGVYCGPLGAQSLSVSTVVHLAAASTLTCLAGNQLAMSETVGGPLNYEVARNFIAISAVP